MSKRRYPTLWVVMFNGCDGWVHSVDTGNPFTRKQAAQRAIAKQGKEKAKMYTLVKYDSPERPTR